MAVKVRKGWPFHPLEMLLDYAVCCFVTFMATIYYLRSYDRAERERDRYKLLALENQINPHLRRGCVKSTWRTINY